jgi:hypothetical protein
MTKPASGIQRRPSKGLAKVSAELDLNGLVRCEHDDASPHADPQGAFLTWHDLAHSADWSAMVDQEVADMQHVGGDGSCHWIPPLSGSL